MLKSWNPPEIPEKEEISLRLDKARGKLYELQMRSKSIRFRYWSCLKDGVPPEKEA